MSLNKLPVPLLIAALVATTAVVIYLQLTVVHAPVVADPNFTTTLVNGTPYLWRGAGSEISITSNATIKLTYMPIAHVVYVNGPLSNASLGDGRWLVYLKGGRPLLVTQMIGAGGTPAVFVFKLINMTKANELSVLVPQQFDVGDTLTQNEVGAINTFTRVTGPWRVVNIYTNGTHIGIDYANHTSATVVGTVFYKLPPAVETTSTSIPSSGYGVSYIYNGTTLSAYLLPYQYIVIVPKASAKVTITVK